MASSARIDELRKKFDENPRRYFAPLANEYRKAGDLEQAIFICQEYLPQQPGHMSGHIVYGQTLFEMGRYEEAKGVFETALSLDPENLIALKHLGDIARQSGDNNAARAWYQRVLEADPRNEEIAQLMLSLLGPSDAGTAAMPVAAEPIGTVTEQPVSSPAPTSVSSPVVAPRVQAPVLDAAAEPQPAAPIADLEIEKSVDNTQLAAVPVAAAEPPPLPPAPPQPPPVLLPERASDALLDLDELSFGVPPAAVAGTPSASATPAPPARTYDEADRFDLGNDEAAFEGDPFAIPAGSAAEPPPLPPLPPVELATDLKLGLPDDATPPAAPSGAVNALEGLETFEAGVASGESREPESSEPLETAPVEGGHDDTELSSAFDGALGEQASVPFDGSFPASAATPEPRPGPAAEAPAGAFVTETMAELYLQQGHLESALEIYQKLVEQRPADQELRERLRALEARVDGTPAEHAEASAPPASTGPTIREFLVGLFTRRATPTLATPLYEEAQVSIQPFEAMPEVSTSTPEASISRAEAPIVTPEASTSTAEASIVTPEASISAVEVEASAGADSDLAASSLPELTPLAEEGGAEAAPAEAEVPAPFAEARRTPALSSETVSGSIDALFSGAEAHSADDSAANTLAEAFAPEGAETTPLQGVPAHRAPNELSLDHVFKANTPPRENQEADAGAAFSFDQFFSDEAGEGAATGGGEPSPGGTGASQGADDIAKFNAWLNGLKKT